jgi:hypothetical protein
MSGFDLRQDEALSIVSQYVSKTIGYNSWLEHETTALNKFDGFRQEVLADLSGFVKNWGVILALELITSFGK